MVDSEAIRIDVSENDRGLLKVSWFYQNMLLLSPYFIPVGMLQEISGRARLALQRLVDKYVEADRENGEAWGSRVSGEGLG